MITNTAILLLAAEALSTTELLQFLVSGLLVVLITLLVLAVFCTLMGIAFKGAGKRAKPEPISATPPVRSGELPEHVMVAIAAAAASVIDRPHRIVRVGIVTEDAWSLERRFQHHSSHKVRRDAR